jgi:hypothetical protein
MMARSLERVARQRAARVAGAGSEGANANAETIWSHIDTRVMELYVVTVQPGRLL